MSLKDFYILNDLFLLLSVFCLLSNLCRVWVTISDRSVIEHGPSETQGLRIGIEYEKHGFDKYA